MAHQVGRADINHLPLPDASVDTIITDPPWHFERRVSPNAKAVKATDYLLIEDDRMFRVFREMHRVLKPRGHCYIFVPERKLELALDLRRRDVYTTWEHFNTVIWVKVRKDGQDLRIGLGHTYRAAMELVLCLSKGHRRPLTGRGVANVMFSSPIGGSRKPPELYRKLAEASTEEGGVILDPFCGSDPLGRAGLVEFQTISFDRYDIPETPVQDLERGDR